MQQTQNEYFFFAKPKKIFLRHCIVKNVQVSATFLLIKSNVLVQYSNKKILGYFVGFLQKFCMKHMIIEFFYEFKGFVIITHSPDSLNTSITFERGSYLLKFITNAAYVEP